MKNIAELSRRVRGISKSHLNDTDFEFVFQLLLENAFSEAYEESEVAKPVSRPPAPDTELAKVLKIVEGGVSVVSEIAKLHLGEDNHKNRMATSSRLSSLAKRGLVTRSSRGEYTAVKASAQPDQEAPAQELQCVPVEP